MANLVYILCGLLCLACAVLLMRGFVRSRSRLLLWSSLCFGLFAVNNGLLVVDIVLLPELDFQGGVWRNLFSASAGSVMLFGLIWELT